MMKLARKLVIKAACRLGLHSYSPDMMKLTFVNDGDANYIYRAENECLFCGGKYCCLVLVPKAKEESV